MNSFYAVIAVVFTVLAVLLGTAGIRALMTRRLFRFTATLTLGLLMLSLAALFGVISISTYGYVALTREKVIAHVKIEPTGYQRFSVWFRFSDNRRLDFDLFGEELYVDAHILKWKPLANIIGLHTLCELDRVAGRYRALDDETTKPRTVASVSRTKPVDMFDLRRTYPFLKAFVDTEYGSATFIMADRPSELELRLSTTGLLIRNVTPSEQSVE
jgi:hypothetical protein